MHNRIANILTFVLVVSALALGIYFLKTAPKIGIAYSVASFIAAVVLYGTAKEAFESVWFGHLFGLCCALTALVFFVIAPVEFWYWAELKGIPYKLVAIVFALASFMIAIILVFGTNFELCELVRGFPTREEFLSKANFWIFNAMWNALYLGMVVSWTLAAAVIVITGIGWYSHGFGVTHVWEKSLILLGALVACVMFAGLAYSFKMGRDMIKRRYNDTVWHRQQVS